MENSPIEKPKQIPEVPFLQLVKRLFWIKKHLLSEIEVMHGQFGDVFGIQADNLKCFIRRPDLIKYVLIDNHLNFEKGEGFKLFHEAIGFGLLTSDGEKWKNDRKVISLEFRRQSTDNNFRLILEELDKLKQDWSEKAELNLSKGINTFTTKTICRILFNWEIDASFIPTFRKWFKDYDTFIGKQQKSFIKLPLWFPLPYLIRARKAVKGLRGFAKELMHDRINSSEDDNNIIKRMHEAGFDEKTVIDHILTMIIAGHETTANTMLFIFVELAKNPEYFQKLKDEVRNFDGEFNYDNISKLQYLDIIIKESMRLWPAVPLFPRIAKTDDRLAEYEVKKGSLIAFSPWIMHRSEKYWDDPHKFYPERFIGKEFEKEYIYFPFSLGPRKCIGADMSTMQIKEVFFYLIKNFDFDIDYTGGDKYFHSVSLTPYKDVWIRNLKII
jgi:cytochrome P450